MHNIFEIKESLKIIALKLERIEERDEDYTTNISWLVLRAKQDRLYQILKKLEEQETQKIKGDGKNE